MPKPRVKIEGLKRALKGHAMSYKVSIANSKEIAIHLKVSEPVIVSHLENLLGSMNGYKFIRTLKLTFMKGQIDSNTSERYFIYRKAYFNGKAKVVINKEDIMYELNETNSSIMDLFNKWISESSGWVLDKLDDDFINVNQYNPLSGSSYIKLPPKLANSRKGLVNIKNNDNECLRWCHVRHMDPNIRNHQRINKMDKDRVKELNYGGIKFPVSHNQYNKVEVQNNIRINVFGYDNGKKFPMYISKEKFDDEMNLLYVTSNDKGHYVLIKDFNRFMYDYTKHKNNKHFCMYCMQCFSSRKILDRHRKNCIATNGIQSIEMPEEGKSILKFNNYNR